MKLYDKTRMLDIAINVVENGNWFDKYDNADNFYADGNCHYNDEMDAWEVEDIDYCIETANAYAAFDREYWDWDTEEELEQLKERYTVEVLYDISDIKEAE